MKFEYLVLGIIGIIVILVILFIFITPKKEFKDYSEELSDKYVSCMDITPNQDLNTIEKYCKAVRCAKLLPSFYGRKDLKSRNTFCEVR